MDVSDVRSRRAGMWSGGWVVVVEGLGCEGEIAADGSVDEEMGDKEMVPLFSLTQEASRG